jgi:deoxyribodipyrimidine photolyase
LISHGAPAEARMSVSLAKGGIGPRHAVARTLEAAKPARRRGIRNGAA